MCVCGRERGYVCVWERERGGEKLGERKDILKGRDKGEREESEK